jgi:Holliday junction resolvase
MSRGHDRERELRRVLEAAGWLCIRAAGSLGPVDVVAIARAGAVHPARALAPARQGEIALIECKSTSGGPYERFGPAERKLLVELAASVGASAWLAYKPKGARAWTWIPSAAWPASATRSVLGVLEDGIAAEMVHRQAARRAAWRSPPAAGELPRGAAAGEPTHNRAKPHTSG